MFSNNYPTRRAIRPDTLPVQPTTLQTAGMSASLAGNEIILALGALDKAGLPAPSKESREDAKNSIDAISQALADPRLEFGQQATNWVSRMAVYGVASAPLFIGADIGAAALVGRSAMAIAPAVPQAVVNFARTPLSRLATGKLADWLPTLTVGQTVKGAVGITAGIKATEFPEHLAHEYDKLTDSYNWKKAAELTLNDNLGVGIGLTISAFGLVAGRALRNVKSNQIAESTKESLEKEIKLSREQKDSKVSKAFETVKQIKAHEKYEQSVKDAISKEHKAGRMSDEEATYSKMYLENPDSEELAPLALRILEKEQTPIDKVNGKVWTKLLNSDDINSLKLAIGDEASFSSKNYHKAISDYTVKNRMDIERVNLSERLSELDGMNAYVHYVNKKLESKGIHLEKLDRFVDSSIKKGLKKVEMISQKNIYKHLKKTSRFDHETAPYMIPENVAHKLSLSKKLIDLQKGKSNRYKKWYKEDAIKKVKEDIKAVKLENSHQELMSLKSKIQKRLNGNYRNSAPYQRLLDLAEVHPEANLLLRRLEDEALMIKHEALSMVIKRFTDFVDSQVGKLANPQKVVNYMKERLERMSPEIKFTDTAKKISYPIKESVKKTTKQLKNKSVEKEILDTHVKNIKKSSSKDSTEEFSIEKKRFDQFTASEKALDALIDCARGFRNV